MLPKPLGHALQGATVANGATALFAGVLGLADDRSDSVRLFGFALVMAGILLMVRPFIPDSRFQRREAMATVTLQWLLMVLLGAVPYLLSGTLDHFFDALYEATAGYTTTSSTVITDVAELSDAMQFWRAGTQWMGAFSALVLLVVIFPRFGLADHGAGPDSVTRQGRELGSTPGVAIGRIALALGFLSLVLSVAYVVAGMGWRDGLFHGLTTSSTGGFSTRNGSIAAFDSAAIEWVAIAGMVAAGASVVHVIRIARGALRSVWRSYELRAYLTLLTIGTIIGALTATDSAGFRSAVFAASSALSTTGLRASDLSTWEPVGIVVLFALMTIGSMGGSPGGGIRIVRMASLLAALRLELQRNLYPRLVAVPKLGRIAVPDAAIGQAAGQIFLTAAVIMVALLGVTSFGAGMLDGLSVTVSVFANSGPAVGAMEPGLGTGPSVSSFDNALVYAPEARVVLIATMFIGRLAVHPVLVTLGVATHETRHLLRHASKSKGALWRRR